MIFWTSRKLEAVKLDIERIEFNVEYFANVIG